MIPWLRFDALIGVLLLGACGSDDSPSTTSGTPQSPSPAKIFVVAMTNDPAGNHVQRYSLAGTLLQDVATGGQGGASGNGGAIAVSPESPHGNNVAVVNYGSNTVTLFSVAQDGKLTSLQTINTVAAPVSVTFGQSAEHLYVAGADQVASYPRSGDRLATDSDGTAALGGAGTGQVVYVNDPVRPWLAVSQKGSDTPSPGTGRIEKVPLVAGSIAGNGQPIALPSAMTPLGMVAADRLLVGTIAHTPFPGMNLVVIQDGTVVSAFSSTQASPCWVDYYQGLVPVSNTAGQSITLLTLTGQTLAVQQLAISTADLGGGPGDIAANYNTVTTLVHAGDTLAYLVIYDSAGGTLTSRRALPVAPTTNGIAVLNLN